MKAKEELKIGVSELIDPTKSKVDILDELSPEQQRELELCIKESEEGDNYSKEEFIKILEQWRAK